MGLVSVGGGDGWDGWMGVHVGGWLYTGASGGGKGGGGRG